MKSNRSRQARKILLVLGMVIAGTWLPAWARTTMATAADAKFVKKTCNKTSDEGCSVEVSMKPASGGPAGTYCVSIVATCGNATCSFNPETSPELCEVSGSDSIVLECDGNTIAMGPATGKTWKSVAGNCGALSLH